MCQSHISKNCGWLFQVTGGILLLICIGSGNGQCPESSSTHPCLCRNGPNATIAELTCRGEVGLVKLTRMLRNPLCGQTVDQFRLLHSDVEYLPSNLFYKVVVKDIQISSTNVSHFTRAGRSAFYGLEDVLTSLSMRRCHLVDGLQWQKVGELRVLTYLDLSYNYLTAVPGQWFMEPPPNLLSLILKGNRITTIEKGAFANMHSLIELDLSENGITVIDRDIFPNPGNSLIFLRLTENNLTYLPYDMFNELMGLRRIYLDNNKIEKLREGTWRPIWGDLGSLDLNGNPLQCGCDASWIAKLKPPLHLYGICQLPDGNSTILRNLEIEQFEFCDRHNINYH